MNQMPVSDAALAPGSLANKREVGKEVPILTLCDEIEESLVRMNAEDGPLNRAEADQLPDQEIEAAHAKQAEILDRIEYLSEYIAERIAESKSEIDGKVRVLDALTSVAAWDRESLRLLRVSIERDRRELARKSDGGRPPRSPRRRWLTRHISFYARSTSVTA